MRTTRLLMDVAVLAAIAEAGSFTKGGASLGLTPSGASRAVSRLEARVGVRLLDRSTRGLRLTAAGAKLHREAAPHLAGLEAAAEAAGGQADSVMGHLRVAATPLVLRHVLAPRLPILAQRCPGLEITFVTAETGDLTAGGVDLAIRFGPQPASAMSALHLLDTRVLTVAAPSYLATFGYPLTPEALTQHACLDFVDPLRGLPFQWEFRQGHVVQPISISARYSFMDVDAMIEAARAGAGIAQVLAFGTEALIDRGDLVELFPDWSGETFPLYVVRPSRRLSSAAVDVFLGFCREACASMGEAN